MTIVVTVLAIAVAALTLLVAGLLRSHATILRRLHELGAGVAEGSSGTTTSGATPGRPAAGVALAPGAVTPPGAADAPSPPRSGTSVDPDLPRPPAVPEGRPAADLTGVGPRGEAQAIRVAGTAHDTVLAFLSSGCTTCHVFWDELRDAGLPRGTRLVVVTKGDDAESPVAVAEIAPAGVTVVMSSEAWTAYQVPGSPYVVHVDGPSGRVRGEGTGPNWHQVQRMLLQGAGDLDARRGAGRKAAADMRREQDVDQVLLASGIEPGDPSLYTRADGTVLEPPA